MALIAPDAWAQDLEPRRWTHLPTGSSFLGAALSRSTGDIFFDPVLIIEDGELELDVLGLSYIHSFEWLGRTARIDVTVPFAHGDWSGLLNSTPASVDRQGFFDPVLRLSMNLWGAPPLRGKAFAAYRASRPNHTTVGAALGVAPPLGDYNPTKLINLGSNRWTLRPQLGVLHQRGRWEFEFTGSVFLFGQNHEFFPGRNERSQNPLWLAQGHVIHAFRAGLWAGFSGGYGFGGRSRINGIPKDDEGRVRYLAVSLGVPIDPRQGLKFSYVASRTNTLNGSDLDSLSVAYTLMLPK